MFFVMPAMMRNTITRARMKVTINPKRARRAKRWMFSGWDLCLFFMHGYYGAPMGLLKIFPGS
jgi:hypothetical protein